MQIVIDIPEEVFNEIISEDNTSYAFFRGSYLYFKEGLQNGTPLPKGHGRLIDEKDLKTLYGLDDRLWWSNAVEEFKDLPTIIEADKESEE